MNKYILIVSVVLLLNSCSKTGEGADSDDVSNETATMEYAGVTMPMDHFVAWVSDEDNKLAKKKELNEIIYKLSYLPKELMAFKELKNEKFTQQKLKETEKHYEAMSYFDLKISIEEGSGELLKYKLSSAQQYDYRIKYLSFDMQNDISLVQGKDTLKAGLYHFERIFGIAPYATVMLAFDNEKFKPDEAFTIIFNDRLFGKGFIKYNYRAKQLIDLPNISNV